MYAAAITKITAFIFYKTMDGITQWILKNWNAQTLHEVDFYNGCDVDAWRYVQSVSTQAQFSFLPGASLECKLKACGRLRLQPRKPFREKELDLSRASVTQIAVTNYINTSTERVPFALNYYHSSLKDHPEVEETDNLRASFGILKGAVAALEPTGSDGKAEQHFPLMIGDQDGIIKTAMLLNEQNIRNGVHRINRDLARTAGLPLFRENDSYILVPANHILAISLHTNPIERAESGLLVQNIPQKGDTVCFLVHEKSMERLFEAFKKAMTNKIDIRPLKDVGLKIQNLREGIVKILATISYFAAPYLTAEQLARLRPTVAPNLQ